MRLHGRRVDSPGKPGQKPFANLWIDGLAGGGTPAPPGRQPQAAQHNLPMNLDDQIPF